MKVTLPLSLTLDSTNVAEPSAGETAYSSGTIYVSGALAIDATSHLTYQALFGGAAQTVTMTATSPGVVQLADHGLAEGSKIAFTTTGSLPAELTASTIYYVQVVDADSFNVSATQAGSAINFSGTGSGTISAYADPNLGYALTDATAWIEAGASNAYKMLELDRNTTTQNADTIRVQVTPADRAPALGLGGVDADTVYVKVEASLFTIRYNDLAKSEDFSTTWSRTSLQTVTADDAYGPFWEKNADLIVPNTSNTTHFVSQSEASSSGDKCLNIYGKAEGYDGLRVFIIDGSNYIECDFDLTDGTAGAVTNSGVWTNADAGIEVAKNGFFRAWIAGTQNAGTTLTCRFYVLNGGAATFAGDGTSGIHLFGAMLDRSLELRPYYPNNGTGFVSGTGNYTVYEYEATLVAREVVDYWDYFLLPFDYTPSVWLDDLPPYTGVDITIALIKDGDTAACSSVVLGSPVDLGVLETDAQSRAVNYSTITRDEFGNATLVPRRNVPAINIETYSPKSRLNQLLAVRDALNAVPGLWIGDDDSESDWFEALQILGIYTQFDLDMIESDEVRLTARLDEI